MTAAIQALRSYLQSYYDTVFQRSYFISVLAMMTILVTANYATPSLQAENIWQSLLLDYLRYCIPFALAYLLQQIHSNSNMRLVREPWFWILLVMAPALFALRVNIEFSQSDFKTMAGSDHLKLFTCLISYAVKILVLVIPVMLLWWLKDRRQMKLYGFQPQENWRLYALLLACMVPLVIAAAQLPDFLAVYPKAIKDAGLTRSDSIPNFLLFELTYALDFFSIEFFFRGFLILAFVKYAGMGAIIPAACFYCCIHFGKPMPEAISSFFGGLLLGIISYHTKSIWGGLFIHLGIALLMEAAAFMIRHF